MISGDAIEFYNANSGAFAIKQGETTIVEIEDGTSGQYFKFYWDGTNWNQITIGSSSDSNDNRWKFISANGGNSETVDLTQPLTFTATSNTANIVLSSVGSPDAIELDYKVNNG